MTEEPTFVARLTPPGASALASLGLVGPRTPRIVGRLFRPFSANRARGAAPSLKPDRPYYGSFGSEIVDDVVLWLDGIDTRAEVHCHGGHAMVDALIAEIVRLGDAIRVGWDVYRERLGDSQIRREATEALALCPTERCAAHLLDQWQGGLDEAFRSIAASPDPRAIDELLAWAPFGEHLVRPWRVLLFGPTNVGKSSLLNALAGYERAIVSNLPGTTRDLLTTTVSLDGWPVELIDGAGLRETSDPTESAGQQRLVEEMGDVDLRIQIVDASRPPSAVDGELQRRYRPACVVGNKSDLGVDPAAARFCRDGVLSAATGEGLENLARQIVRRLVPETPAPGTPIPFTRRQVEWLEALRGAAVPVDVASRLP